MIFAPGALVRFIWWSSYKAPEWIPGSQFTQVPRQTWHEIFPGEIGMVIEDEQDPLKSSDYVVVLFPRLKVRLRIHSSMLEVLV